MDAADRIADLEAQLVAERDLCRYFQSKAARAKAGLRDQQRQIAHLKKHLTRVTRERDQFKADPEGAWRDLVRGLRLERDQLLAQLPDPEGTP